MAVILRFQTTGTIPGDAEPVRMRGPSLTIGRGEENDLVLPDPDRMVSKRHCAIEDHGGNIVVIDLSTNGTFLNYGKAALGKVPAPLNDGDILTIGPYELLVEIPADRARDTLADPAPTGDAPVSPGQAEAGDLGDLLDDPAGGDRFLDDLLGEAPGGPRRVRRADPADDGLLPPLGEDEGLLPPLPDPDDGLGASAPQHGAAMHDHFLPGPAPARIPDDWDEEIDDLLAPPPGGAMPIPDDPFAEPPPAAPEASAPVAPPPPEAAAPQHAAAPPRPDPERSAALPTAPQPAAASTAAGADRAARAFLDALGAGHLGVPEAELEATMARLGAAMRVMVEGLREVLMTRSAIKSEFRIQQTMIASGANNPLKFSISPEQAIEAMVRPTTRGYLDAVAAAEQALSDIKAHEVATMTGLEAALRDILRKLAPDVLAGKIETRGGLSGLLGGRKAKYWEIYEKIYAELADQAENDFHALFAREFARAYQQQLERLK